MSPVYCLQRRSCGCQHCRGAKRSHPPIPAFVPFVFHTVTSFAGECRHSLGTKDDCLIFEPVEICSLNKLTNLARLFLPVTWKFSFALMAVFLLTVCRKLDTFASNTLFVNCVSVLSLWVMNEDMPCIKTLRKPFFQFICTGSFVSSVVHSLTVFMSCIFPFKGGWRVFPLFSKRGSVCPPKFHVVHPPNAE